MKRRCTAILTVLLLLCALGVAEEGAARRIYRMQTGEYIEASLSPTQMCAGCSGTGVCSVCSGAGRRRGSLLGFGCWKCQGSGRCTDCGGVGKIAPYVEILRENKADYRMGVIRTGTDADLHTCMCYGTGLCLQCNGSGVLESTGNKCFFCRGSGVCPACQGVGYETRKQHNDRVSRR